MYGRQHGHWPETGLWEPKDEILDVGSRTWGESGRIGYYGRATGTRTMIASLTRTIRLENFSLPTFRMDS